MSFNSRNNVLAESKRQNPSTGHESELVPPTQLPKSHLNTFTYLLRGLSLRGRFQRDVPNKLL